MSIQTLEVELMGARPDLALLHERMKDFAEQADAIADIPPGFFEGVDVRNLNCNGFEHGGNPASTVAERCRMFELLGHADPALAVALPGASLTLYVLQNLASCTQREKIIALMQSERPCWGAFALSEPRSGSDATNLLLSASAVPGGYLLNGEKCYIGNAGRAQFAVVFATIDERKGQFGIRAFLLQLPHPGLIIDDTNRMLGLRAVRVSSLTFDNCLVPEEAMLGHGTMLDLARTFAFAQLSFDSVRPCLSSLMVGAGFGLIDQLRGLTTASRKLSSAIECLTEKFAGPLQSARLLCRNAAAFADAKIPSSTSSSICKLFATEQVCAFVDQALLLPGIASHSSYQALTRLHRDFQAFRMMEGTNDVNRLMIARDRIVLHRKLEIAQQSQSDRENPRQQLVA